MPILNYTTEVSAQKSLHEIQVMLAKAKALAVLTEFSEDGAVKAISFRVNIAECGVMSFRLPANVEKVYAVLCRERIAPRFQSKEQAGRVAWRIIKDWLEAQLALVQMRQVTFEQVFLPYAQDHEGVTLYDQLKDGKFQGLALPTPAIP